MKTKRPLVLLVALIVLVALPTAVVFAKELGSLTITGPGIKGELTLNDPTYMMKLEQSGFFETAVLADPPKNLDRNAGYSIVALLNLDGKLVPMAELTYYPMNDGQPGYVHYTGRMQGETLRAVDEWHILNRTADTTFRDMMTANSITLQSALVAASVISEEPAASAAEPATVPVTTAPASPIYTIVVIVLAFALLVGASLMIRRRTTSTAG